MRNRSGIGTHADDAANAETISQAEHRGDEGSPVVIGLGAAEDQDVSILSVAAGGGLDRRPVDPRGDPVDDVHCRAPGAVIEQPFGIELDDRFCPGGLDEVTGGEAGRLPRIDPPVEVDDEDRIEKVEIKKALF